MESTLQYIFWIIGFYLLLGILFSLIFIRRGLVKVDPETQGSGLFFKVLIFPGLIVFWVLFLIKWIKIRNA